MRSIIKRATRVDPISSRSLVTSGGVSSAHHGNTRRPCPASTSGSRRNSASRPTADILSHIQELKDQERHVLSRGARDPSSAPGSAATGPGGMTGPPSLPPNVAETLSRQERLAREDKLAAQYREQLRTKLRVIRDTAIDLGAQKATMSHFERQLFGSGSPKEADLLELERVNGVRSLLGLPPLPQPSAASLSAGAGGVRTSRPGTPIYAASSPTNIPSPYSHRPGVGAQAKHCRTSSFGESSLARTVDRQHRHTATPSRDARRHQAEDDDMEQDMDLGMEDGELSEEGELAE
ncbi:hypothetical protein H4S02_007701 [Coemansia sp. RSA 2611]|nr:hypothetical protein H4S02_007701 [Coemansia sp. RSA 2611]